MLNKNPIRDLLLGVKEGKISIEKAIRLTQNLFYEDIEFAKIDNFRPVIRGFPEVIFCKGKTIEEIKQIVDKMIRSPHPLLLTKANKEIFDKLFSEYSSLNFNSKAKLIYKYGKKIKINKSSIGVITAGTGDIPIAEEAVVTAKVLGNKVTKIYDVGVAGIHRLIGERGEISKNKILIVVAGMEGALPSVVSGMVSSPIIAVPTSIGYGFNFKGLAALLGMLNSCSPGVVVVNVDNGFGAGYFASLINR